MSQQSLQIRKTKEFDKWYKSLSLTLRTRIDARLDHIETIGHFGDSRSLGYGLFELKWKNGMRVYYSRKKIKGIDIIILWGGFKISQEADITKARRLKEEYEYALEQEAA